MIPVGPRHFGLHGSLPPFKKNFLIVLYDCWCEDESINIIHKLFSSSFSSSDFKSNSNIFMGS